MMIDIAESNINRLGLLDGVQKVIIGYSGGPDSTFLKEVLKRKAEKIILAYFNHNMRADSGEEQEFVTREAEKDGLDIEIGSGDVVKYSERNSLSPEEGARKLRFDFLNKVRERMGADVIALGHNLDDQIENFFIRLIRGSGFGLSSMDFRDGHIIRPLLNIRKNDIVQFLKDSSIPFYVDPSNQDTDFLRNDIRKNLIPHIEKISDNPIKGIERSIKNIGDMEKALKERVDLIEIDRYMKHCEVKRSIFDSLFQSEKYLLIRKMLSFLNLERAIRRIHITELPERGVIELSGGFIETVPDRLIVITGKIDRNKNLEINDKIKYNDFEITAEILENIESPGTGGTEYFELSELDLPIRVRCRKEGDRIEVFGSNNTKKTADVFINKKVPRTIRDIWPVIEDSKDIIMIPGLVRSNKAVIKKQTEEILKIGYREVKYA